MIGARRMALLGGARSSALTRDQAIARYGIVAQWKLDDANDSVGSNHLTLVNSPTFAAGKVGNAMTLVSASSQYASVADNSVLSMGGNVDFGFSLFVNFVTLPGSGGTMVLLSKFLSSAGGRAYLLDVTNNGDGTYGIRWLLRNAADAANVSATITQALITGTWYHLFPYYDRVGGLVGLCLNGGAATTASLVGGVPDDTAAFLLGTYDTASDRLLNGRIDAVMGFKSPPLGMAALATEIRDWAYNGGVGREL